MDRPHIDIQLELARRQQSPILANLLELYAHDFTELQPLDMEGLAINGRSATFIGLIQ
jgi:hypothetical protein